jgi:hypothetical protein
MNSDNFHNKKFFGRWSSGVMGTEPRVLHMLDKHSTTEIQPQPKKYVLNE